MKQAITSTLSLVISLLSVALADKRDTVRGVKEAPSRRQLKNNKNPAPAPTPSGPTDENQVTCDGPTSCCCKVSYNGINQNIGTRVCTIGGDKGTGQPCAPPEKPPGVGNDLACSRFDYDYVILESTIQGLIYSLTVYGSAGSVAFDVCHLISGNGVANITSHSVYWGGNKTDLVSPGKVADCTDISQKGGLKDALGNCPDQINLAVTMNGDVNPTLANLTRTYVYVAPTTSVPATSTVPP